MIRVRTVLIASAVVVLVLGLERDFGRRVALNSIAKNGLVEIRAEQVFARWHLASDRAPRASAVEEFPAVSHSCLSEGFSRRRIARDAAAKWLIR